MGMNDNISGSNSNDLLFGGNGKDTISGNEGNDSISGGNGKDLLLDSFGSDTLDGGRGDDVLHTFSDAGEPEIAQTTDESKVYPDQPYLDANDVLTGGNGADLFRFDLLLNAKYEIAAKHADAVTGEINWRAVAGENDNVHDHWVDAIGDDIILDYSSDQGDRISIYGHTVEASLTYSDVDGDGVNESIISLVSNQGGAGAHQGDQLGTITVFGDPVLESDLSVDRRVFYGAADTLAELV